MKPRGTPQSFREHLPKIFWFGVFIGVAQVLAWVAREDKTGGIGWLIAVFLVSLVTLFALEGLHTLARQRRLKEYEQHWDYIRLMREIHLEAETAELMRRFSSMRAGPSEVRVGTGPDAEERLRRWQTVARVMRGAGEEHEEGRRKSKLRIHIHDARLAAPQFRIIRSDEATIEVEEERDDEPQDR